MFGSEIRDKDGVVATVSRPANRPFFLLTLIV
jgi:hypothetical protein